LPDGGAASGGCHRAAPHRLRRDDRGTRGGGPQRRSRRARRRPGAGGHGRPSRTAEGMSTPQRAKLADELVRRMAAALRGAQLYAAGHPLVNRNITALADTLTLVHASAPSIAIGIV